MIYNAKVLAATAIATAGAVHSPDKYHAFLIFLILIVAVELIGKK